MVTEIKPIHTSVGYGFEYQTEDTWSAVIEFEPDHMMVGAAGDGSWQGSAIDYAAAEHLRDQITAWLERRKW